MVIRERQVDRECITGAIIFICIFVIIVSIVSIRFLDVKVTNIELVDRGLYTVITDNGPINVSQDDVLRIERTYPKAAITGAIVEQDKIYTTKGFIYISKLDPFYDAGRQLINSVDFEGKSVWIKTNKSEATESEEIWNQLLDSNLRAVQPYSFAIGTPEKFASIIFSVLSLQYFALAIGGMALVILIFPLRLVTPMPVQTFRQEDKEYSSPEEIIGVVIK
ncbi:MAG: hypothetical protein APF81_18575 [Desulfosporosinus sp. BRH_c37]|nr:MAG: hypothetical protein APF81_18575 [Desulfosporosinus sp. BRH_c37]